MQFLSNRARPPRDRSRGLVPLLAGSFACTIVLAPLIGCASDPTRTERAASPSPATENAPTTDREDDAEEFGGRREYSHPAMGVHARIVLHAPDRATADAAAEAAIAAIDHWEQVLGDYDPESILRQLEARFEVGRWLEVDRDLGSAITTALRLATETGFAFDPTVGALTRRWRAARAEGRVLTEEEERVARAATGLHLVEFDVGRSRLRVRHPDVRFDFGGIGKGIAAQAAVEAARAAGCPSVLVDLGGDLVLGAAPPGRDGWRIGIDVGPAADAPTLTLADCAIATSGDREQHLVIDGVRWSHIVDPKAHTPVRSAPQITVVAPDGATADAWATALSVHPSLRTRLDGRAGVQVWIEPTPRDP